MSSPVQSQTPSPVLIFETLNAYQRSGALRAAIELDVFTAIADGNSTSTAIAAQIHASQKGTRVLCDYLTLIGFLKKHGEDYALTSDSSLFLNRHSPEYMGSVSRFLGSLEGVAAFNDIAAIVRKGGTVMAQEGTVSAENPIWVEFARSMAPLMKMPAQLIAKLIGASEGAKWKVLDIAAGHGLFGITMASRNPNAEIVAVDWAPVLQVAEENARDAGVADRFSKIPGSAFEVDFGSGYDIVLITNFLHHFDIATNESLLRKVHAALAPGGRAVTAEFIPNEDRVSPPVDASFSLMMLGSTASGDAYTFSEYDRMFRNAGFSRNEMRELAPSPQRVIVSYK
jgi:2-polyprenyl-3-methyl-5-hydroxy-6-metoxy-1,4-benzoquinol methylase